MLKHTVAQVLLPIGIIFTFNPLVLSAGEDQATEFVAFSEAADQDCEERGGMRVFVRNLHNKQIIDLHLDRYFSGVRQGGRSMFALAPGASQALGCSRVFDARQNWTLVRADLISIAKATDRYGEIIGAVAAK